MNKPVLIRARGQIAAYLILTLCTACTYFRVLSFDFVWDDTTFVVRNFSIRSWHYVPKYFTDLTTYSEVGTWAPMYRPLRNISYLIDYSIFGLNPKWFHLHNLILHVLNVWLAYALLQRLITIFDASPDHRTGLVCLLAALMWALHPVQTEAVAWIKCRDELLFCLFYFGALLVYCRLLSDGMNCVTAPGSNRVSRVCVWSGFAGIFVLFGLSILSKEMAATFPVIAFLIYWYGRRRLMPAARRIAWLTSCGTFALLIGYMAARHLVIGQTQQQGLLAETAYYQFLTMVRAVGTYIRLAIAPGTLLADYQGFPISRSILEPGVFASAGATIALLVSAFLCRRQPLVTMGVLWFFITLLPVLNIIPSMQFLAERFLYLPLFGMGLAATGIILWVINRIHLTNPEPTVATRKTRLVLILFVCAIGAHLLANVSRLSVWQNSTLLYSRTYIDSPPSGRIWWNYASALISEKRYAEALPILRELVHTEDTRLLHAASDSKLAQGYGLALVMTGSTDEGTSQTLRALELDPDNPEALAVMAMQYGTRGDHQRALEYYQKALNFRPENAVLHVHTGIALSNLGRHEEAIESWETALLYGAPAAATRQRIDEVESLLKQAGKR